MATPPNNSSSASGGKDSPQREIILARWSERFIAWLIDVVIVYVGLAILFALISIPFWIYFGTRGMDGLSEKQFEPFHYIVSALVFLAYWTYFESYQWSVYRQESNEPQDNYIRWKSCRQKENSSICFWKSVLA